MCIHLVFFFTKEESVICCCLFKRLEFFDETNTGNILIVLTFPTKMWHYFALLVFNFRDHVAL